MRARVYLPRGRPQQTVLLVSGVHPTGIDEPRLRRHAHGVAFAIVIGMDSLGRLERTLIDGFLRSRGVESHALSLLPESDREKLLADASIYASGKLMEVEARSHYLEQIHDDAAIAALAPARGTSEKEPAS